MSDSTRRVSEITPGTRIFDPGTAEWRTVVAITAPTLGTLTLWFDTDGQEQEQPQGRSFPSRDRVVVDTNPSAPILRTGKAVCCSQCRYPLKDCPPAPRGAPAPLCGLCEAQEPLF